MSCKRYKEMLPLYVTGDLSRAEEQEVDHHVEGCAECRAEVDKLAEVVAMLTPDESDSLSEVEKLRMEKEIYRRLAGRSGADAVVRDDRTPMRILLGIAAAVVFFFMGYLTSDLMTEPTNGGRPMAQLERGSGVVAEYRRAVASGYRFSAEGLKVIARGKAALAKKPGQPTNGE